MLAKNTLDQTKKWTLNRLNEDINFRNLFEIECNTDIDGCFIINVYRKNDRSESIRFYGKKNGVTISHWPKSNSILNLEFKLDAIDFKYFFGNYSILNESVKILIPDIPEREL